MGGAIIWFAALLGIATILLAQVATGEIYLQVTDPCGAPMEAAV
jgi:hypothetical protein